ncbi:VWA domain-containing protein [candidate division KSB1 bacterium]|nr:VWA domain-containing protein [candidate division KSB1 bacterium]
MSSKKLLLVVCLLGLILAKTTSSWAVGALFVRPLWSTQTHTLMWIKNVDTRVTIQDQIAATHLDQTFYNEMNTQVEAVFVFPLPEGALITELVYWFNGQRYVARVRELQAAINDYNNKIRRNIDPALLQYLGNNLFRLNIAPINAKSDVRFEITYTELLNYDFGMVSYEFLLKTTALSPKPLNRVSLTIDVKTQANIKYLKSPSHQNSTATQINKLAPNQYHIVFGDENFHPDRDFKLQFETFREHVDIHVLTYSPTVADSFGTDAFYTLWITPPDSLDDQSVIPKNITFAVDVSSSMEGERMRQLRTALNSFLDHLLPIDKFNIVSFGTHVVSFQPDLVTASPVNIAAAREYVRQLIALGLTNINQALLKALNQSYQDSTMNILVFLTDGYPTWDETDIAKILENTRQANKRNTHIFSFGVGTDLSTSLLENLATENGGYAQYITADDSIALMIANHFQRISKPVLDELKIEIPGLLSLDRYPRTLPALFWGHQVFEMGRYSNSGAFDVILKAKMRGQHIQFSSPVNFADTTGGCRFVARLWAKSKIDYLLKEIELYGEKKELVDAIIDLSIRFGILTRYTALYVDPEDPPPSDVQDGKGVPSIETYELAQNYPNPFNPQTEIAYTLPPGQATHFVVLKVYDSLGRLIKILVQGQKTSGKYRVIWDGTNELQQKVPSGVYFCVLEIGKIRLTRKMILMK